MRSYAMSNRTGRAAALLAVLMLPLTTFGGGPITDIEWINTAGGNWNTAANWDPTNVPDAADERALILDAGTYTVTLDLAPTIDSLDIGNPDATLTISPARTLTLASGNATNNGLIQLNPIGSASDSVLSFGASGTLDGSGELWMRTSGNNSRLESAADVTLTLGLNQVVRGVGEINAAIDNNGEIRADASVSVSGNLLELQTNNKSNDGVFSSVAGSTLAIQNITVTQTESALIVGDGGEVQLDGGATIIGGTLSSTGDGFVESGSGTVTLQDVASDATYFVRPATTTVLSGTAFTNDGVISVNVEGSASNGVIHSSDSLSIGGSGEIQLRASSDNAQVTTPDGVTIVHGAGHLIRGVGQYKAATTNEGEIRADASVATSGNDLDVFDRDITNNSLMSAADGSFLDLTGITITQSETAVIRALDGGTVRPGNDLTITGGTLDAQGSGAFSTLGGTTTLADLTNQAPFTGNAAHTIVIGGSGITNNGVFFLNPTGSAADVVVRFDTNASLLGSGEIQMHKSGNDSQLTTALDATVTIGPDQLVRGVGNVTAALVNEGEIRADVSVSVGGDDLDIFGSDKVNNAVMSAAAGSFLDITGITLTNGPAATLEANGGVIRAGTSASILNGTINSTDGGFAQTLGGTLTLTNVVNNIFFQILPAHTMAIAGDGITNNGIIELNVAGSASNAILHFEETGTLGGTGEVQMRTSADNSQLTSAEDVTVTVGADQLVRGVGQVTASLVNEGEIRADAGVSVSGNDLDVFGADKVNNALMSAVADSFLDITGITVTNGGGAEIRADAGTVRTGNATIVGGVLSTPNDGAFSTQSGTTSLDGANLVGTFNLNAGHTISHVGDGLTNNGQINVNPQGSAADGVFSIDTEAALGGSGEIRLLSGGNDARIQATSGFTLNHGTQHTIAGRGEINGAVNNMGTVVADASTSMAIKPSGAGFVNNGIVRSSTSLVVNTGSLFSNQSTVIVDEGATMTVNGGYNQPNGTTTVNGTLTGTANIDTGVLNGIGLVSGTVNNDGASVEPGESIGELTVNVYNQEPLGRVQIELAGTGEGEFDVLHVNNAATLTGGTLEIVLDNFLPADGDSFTIMTYGSIGGAFSNISGLCTPNGLVFTLDYGANALTITAGAAECPISIVSSDPPPFAIDARQPTSLDGTQVFGFETIDIVFDGDTSELTPADFTILVTSGAAPGIDSLVSNGNTVTLNLDAPIPPGAWTAFIHNDSGTRTALGFLPADVSGDGTAAAPDVLTLIDFLNGQSVLPFYATDIDRSGLATAADVLRVIDLLNGANAFDVWNGMSLPAPPTQ